MAADDVEDLAAVRPCGPVRAGELRRVATDLVRRSLADPDDSDALARIDAIGAEAVRASANLSRCFGGDDALGREAERTLEELRRLVETVHAEPVRRRFRLFSEAPKSPAARLQAAEPRLNIFLDELAHQHDGLSREAIRLRGVIEELRRADGALEDAAHLCRALEAAFGSAARELERTDPPRAARIRDALALRLSERLRDILTQLIVVRQGRLALSAILEGQEALARTLGRTRHTLVAALRTAVAARRSAGQSRLERPPAEDSSHGELSRAIEAMRSALQPGSSP